MSILARMRLVASQLRDNAMLAAVRDRGPPRRPELGDHASEIIETAAALLEGVETFAVARRYDAWQYGDWNSNDGFRQAAILRIGELIGRELAQRGCVIITAHEPNVDEAHRPVFTVEGELYVIRPEGVAGTRFSEDIHTARRAGAEAMRESIKAQLAWIKKSRGSQHWVEGLDYAISTARVDDVIGRVE